jgi:hypothetical protein
MIYTGLVSKAKPHPGLDLEKFSKIWKHPLFLAHGNNVFEYGSVYIIEKKIEKEKTIVSLAITVLVILAFIFFEQWPEWL